MSVSVRSMMFAAAAAGLFLVVQPARADYVYGVVANDTGGIIPWSPFTEQHRHEIAAWHCARYRKYPKITSVHRQYGDYIGFRCLFGPPAGPVVVTKY